MRTYEKYKDSGISWIGEIPEKWVVGRLKDFSSITLGKMLCSTPPDNIQYDYTLEYYLKSRNIGDLQVHVDNVDKMWFSSDEKKIYKLHDGDIVMNEGGDIGKLGLWSNQIENCYIQNSVHKITANIDVYNKYLLYWLKYASLKRYFWSIVSQISIAHLTKEKISNTPVVLPEKKLQKAIANYLDKKTAEIDKIIAEREKKIELLNELKSSIISRAVTKGINPHAKMKDSGIDWIGEIPEGWEVRRLKYIGESGNGLTYSPNDTTKDSEKGILVLRSSNIQDNKLSLEDNVFVNEAPLKLMVRKGDIIICSRNGSVCIFLI